MSVKTFTVDADKSVINWTGKKLTGSHNGTIKLVSGVVETENDEIVGGNFKIDTTSIVIDDIKDAATNAMFKGHLVSDDFFAVEKFPTASFAISNAEKIGDHHYKIFGQLTVRGVTNDQSFDAHVKIEGDHLSANGDIVVDRTKYGIKYGSGNFFKGLGDKLIDNEFHLDLQLVTRWQKAADAVHA